MLDLEQELQSAAISGDADEVTRLISNLVSVNSRNMVCVLVFDWLSVSLHYYTAQDGKTALHLAAEHGYITVVQVLISANADINLQDEVLCLRGIDL